MPVRAKQPTETGLQRRKDEGRVELLEGVPFDNEHDYHIIACNAYLRLGPGRKLKSKYKDVDESVGELGIDWAQVSKQFDWEKRAIAYDARIDREQHEAYAAAMTTGYATDFERVLTLKQMATELVTKFFTADEDGWMPWTWGANRGKPVLNVNLVREIRGLFDDLAKETGGRRQQLDHHVDSQIIVKGYMNVTPDVWDDAPAAPTAVEEPSDAG